MRDQYYKGEEAAERGGFPEDKVKDFYRSRGNNNAGLAGPGDRGNRPGAGRGRIPVPVGGLPFWFEFVGGYVFGFSIWARKVGYAVSLSFGIHPL